MPSFDLATLAVHGPSVPTTDPSSDRLRHDPTGAVLTPIHQSTTFARTNLDTEPDHSYSRASNPTVSALERALGHVEGALDAVCFTTGMAATTTLCLSLLRAGDRVVAGGAVYGGTFRLLETILRPFGVDTVFVDAADLESLAAALDDGTTRNRTRLLILETPANPTLALTDIDAASRLGRAAGATVVVDNTFLTPFLQRPLDLGADVVLHSTTKYIDGHNATVGGALLVRDPALRARFVETRTAIGTIQSPFEAWLTLQGLKTAALRVPRQSESALAIAQWLAAHARVERVHYPFLDDFPQHGLARRQQQAGGAIVSFEIGADGTTSSFDAARDLARHLRLTILAENLGATETLLTHPASMTHAAMPKAHRDAIGLTDGLLRLSVGLESVDDLVADLEQALTKSTASKDVSP